MREAERQRGGREHGVMALANSGGAHIEESKNITYLNKTKNSKNPCK